VVKIYRVIRITLNQLV